MAQAKSAMAAVPVLPRPTEEKKAAAQGPHKREIDDDKGPLTHGFMKL
jgi:hypothetical protein